ncbi:MAG: alanine--tRNA ligase [Clostridiales bacterium GWF2_38_85]|nr:MAG: alanine--tRNA ligase [Clostridiales bacterium GWF2_38_85]HBL84064.1 alanine--tRNA ligase [Clostridiales bacterium]
MKKLGINELREKYLSFFESKDHLRLPSFPLVPINDNSLLLINAGMAPFKLYFTGEQKPPNSRVTTCQKCVRTLDIENVGKTARHGTFFEMLGNFSFGDYFKEQAIPWAWEFLTKVLEIPENLLHVSVFEDDDEAEAIWLKTGVPIERITRMGRDDNFWEIENFPCGPCSEIYFDRGEKYGCGKPDCKVGCNCDRYIEIWNIVFTQFNSDSNGNYIRLARPNIDTGMGLERLGCVMQDVNNLFEVDTIRNIMDHVCRIAGVDYDASLVNKDVSLRVITDHIRGTVFLISDGVVPSNEGRGYILRRLLRRAARHGKLLGINHTFLYELCDTVINESGNAYPELIKKRDYIKKTVKVEEERFNQTIDAGLTILNQIISDCKTNNISTISGDDLFKLHDTFGFPLDLTREISIENELQIDEKTFTELMKQQKERARAARTTFGDFGWNDDSLSNIDKSLKTEFVGYTEIECSANIIAMLSNNESIGRLEGDSGLILLDKTPFYAESGGQVGDTGKIYTSNGVFEVINTKKTHDGQTVHIGKVISGVINIVDKAKAEVDVARRNSIKRNHSSAHLLQAALRKVLGTHVEQAGSYVDDKRMRFDFTHFTAMESDEITAVENLVNEQILTGSSITTKLMSIDEAKTSGAMALFGEKYGEAVRVVRMGDFSTELCGGTHLDNTAKVGLFKIISETSVAAGIRRIEAVTGTNFIELYNFINNLIHETAKELKLNNINEIAAKSCAIQAESKTLKKALDNANLKLAMVTIEHEVNNAVTIGKVKLIRAKFENTDIEALRNAIDNIKDKNPKIVALFTTVNDGKLLLASGCGKAAVAAKAHAGMLLKELSQIVGGGGGGRPDSASSGGKDTSKLDEAMTAAETIILNQQNK